MGYIGLSVLSNSNTCDVGVSPLNNVCIGLYKCVYCVYGWLRRRLHVVLSRVVCRCVVCVGKDSHSGGLENLLSASSLAETHISPDDMPYTDQDDNRTFRHRRSRGALGTRAPPGQRKIFWGPNVQKKVISAPLGSTCTPGRVIVQTSRRFSLGGGDLEGGSG